MTASPAIELSSVLRRIYIEPIQSIVIIDDEYKTLWDTDNGSGENVESEKAPVISQEAQDDDDLNEPVSLSSSDDVEEKNNTDMKDTAEIAQKILNSCKEQFILHVDNRPHTPDSIIEKADFLILDYFLAPNDPSHAQTILKKFIRKEGFSLCVVHTNERVQEVFENLSHEFEIIENAERQDHFSGQGFFIAIINKGDKEVSEVADIFQKIIDGMLVSPPTPLTMLVQSCLTNIHKQSQKIASGIFSNPATRAGILFHTLSQEINTKCAGHVEKLRYKDLVERIFEDISTNVYTDNESGTLDVLRYLVCEAQDRAPFPFAKDREKSEKNDLDIMLRLNAHLCSHEPRFDHITTGTIFKSENDEYYLCTSPSCDTTPGRTMEKQGKPSIVCQRAKLRGGNYFGCILLEEIEENKRGKALRDAEYGRHLFVLVSDEVKVFQALDNNNLPYAYTFYANNGGYINARNKTINVQFTTYDEDKEELILTTAHMTVIGQLRHLHASNLLQKFGVYKSRIGVDFRRHPPQQSR